MAGNAAAARSPSVQAARGAVLAIASVWAVWLVGAQVLLWTPLLRSLINAHQPAVHVEYDFAWSVWPGTVHARGLVITSQDRGVQWRLGIDRLSTRIALGQLPSRIFHASHVRGRGVVFALRRRLYLEEITPERTVGLPRIDDFPPLPLRAAGPEDDLPDFRYRLLSIWLEDIEGEDVREIWIDQVRLDGRARVAGAFYLKPLREVLVAPAELQIDRGDLLRGEERLAEALQGGLRLRLDKFDPRTTPPAQLARRLDVDADLRGRIATLPFATAIGDAHAVLHVATGKVERGSAVDLNLGGIRSGVARAGAVVLRAEVQDGLHAVAEASALRVPGAGIEKARIEVSGDRPDLSDLQLPARASIDVDGGRVEDAARFQRLFADEARFEAGQGTFAAHLEGPVRKLSGWARVRLSHVRMRARGVVLQGDARIDAVVARLGMRSADLAGTRIAIQNGRLFGEDIAPAWWGRFVLQEGLLKFEGPRVETKFAAHCRDARPIVGLFARLADLPGIVKGLFSMDGLSLEGSAAVAPGFFSLDDLVARGDGASIEAMVRQDANGQRGAALLTVQGIPVALDLDGGASLHLFGPGDFYAQRKKEVAETPPAPRARRGTTRRR